MQNVSPKKALGQHFLKDEGITQKIANLLLHKEIAKPFSLLEIGPGTGVLTKYLIQQEGINFKAIDVDKESVEYLHAKYPEQKEQLLLADFLRLPLNAYFGEQAFHIIGNFPYNISSQIFFKILENKDLVPSVVCMLQKEVAQRLASKEGNKEYGILSVLLQAFYHIKYAFTVPPHVFNPPPKVQSGVIVLERNSRKEMPCKESDFFKLVKQAFNNRRKTLRNSLAPFNMADELRQDPVFDLRAEQLSVDAFIELTAKVFPLR